MSNVAVIFAGGTGQRMNTRTRPKQFLELHGKPIIVYTLEAFDQHSEIDGIVVVMLESWIGYTQELVRKFGLKKIRTQARSPSITDCVLRLSFTERTT